MTGAHTVCFPFAGDLVGGSHVSAAGLIRCLDRQRFRPLVVLDRTDGNMARFFSDQRIAFEPAPPSPHLDHGRRIGIGSALKLVWNTPSLARFLAEREVRIVHSNDGRTHATWGLAAKLSGAHLLWHHRGDPGALGLRIAAPLLADRIVAVSEFARPAGGWLSARGRSQVIHSPFDTDRPHDRSAARAALQALVPGGEETRYIGFCGVLIPRKRPLLFVEAIHALRQRAPTLDVRGVIFGSSLDGMDELVHRRACELGVEDRVHLLGHREPGAFWLSACDQLMVPAVHEPFGRTLIEAMLAGTPVVATASGGNLEAIRDGETGRLARPEDADDLARASHELLVDRPRAASIAAAAQAEAQRRFGEDVHAEAIMALYDDLLRVPPRRRGAVSRLRAAPADPLG